MKVLMLNDIQYIHLARRSLQEAHSLIDAGYDVRILTRAEGGDTKDSRGEVEGIPTEWLAIRGRDPRFKWLYRLAGLKLGSYAAGLWSVLTMRRTFALRALPRAIAARADIYHARDLNTLELAYRAARANNARVVYDANELFPDLDNPWVRLKRKSWMRLERELMPKVDLTITVSEFIAQEMARRNNVPLPLVVLNCPDVPPDFDPNAHHDRFGERLGIAAECKIVLYHGYIYHGRGLENLVRAARHLSDNAVVVIMGASDASERFRESLKRLALEAPGRVHILPPVPHQQLLPYVASADVGMIPIQSRGLHYRLTLPNRLFDFIQAAVPVVASDLPPYRKIVGGYNLGVVADLNSPESYAAAINNILSRPDGGAEFRENLLRIAPQYTWQAQARKLVAAFDELSYDARASEPRVS